MPRVPVLALIALLLLAAAGAARAQDLGRDWETCLAASTAPDAAIKACSTLIFLGAGEPARRAAAFAFRGWGYAEKGAYDAAITDFDQALRLDPRSTAAFLGRARAHSGKGEERRAVADLDEAIRLAPELAEAWNNRCWSRALLGELEAALADCREALRLAPQAATFDSLGFVELKLGHYAAAIAAYDEAIRQAPAMPAPYYARGIAKRRLGDTAGGDADIAAATRLEPEIAAFAARNGLTP